MGAVGVVSQTELGLVLVSDWTDGLVRQARVPIPTALFLGGVCVCVCVCVCASLRVSVCVLEQDLKTHTHTHKYKYKILCSHVFIYCYLFRSIYAYYLISTFFDTHHPILPHEPHRAAGQLSISPLFLIKALIS